MSYNSPFFFFRTLWGALCHADWDAAANRGLLALVAEFFRALSGMSAWPFFVPLDSTWQPADIRALLQAHGIESWGWGKQDAEFFFQVKLRQANWAQYLLQQHSVPISGQLLDESARSAYRPGQRRSLRPAAAAKVTKATAVDAPPAGARPVNSQPVPEAKAAPSFLNDPVGQINRTVDRLAKW